MLSQVFRDAMIEKHPLRVLSYPLTVHHLIELPREGDRGFDLCHPLPGLNFAENYYVGHGREGAEVRRECDQQVRLSRQQCSGIVGVNGDGTIGTRCVVHYFYSRMGTCTVPVTVTVAANLRRQLRSS